MTMFKKMIAIFFLMILLIVVINTYQISSNTISSFDESTSSRFRNMSVNMIGNTEQYFNMMELTIEDLTSDINFMEAFYQISQHGDADPAAAQVWQNKMSNTLYHSAIADNFYRVSIFSENGFYLSNHIDRNDSLVSMSEEAQEIIAGIPYLSKAVQTPYHRHIIAPHRDHFTLGKEAMVFSVIQSITLHGKAIGFIEVTADTAELANLFRTDSPSVMVYAVFDDGTVIYDTGIPGVEYGGIPLNEFLDYKDRSGPHLNVYHSQNRWLGMDLYLTQDISVLSNMQFELVARYIRFSAIIACIALLLVVITSKGLTRSIRLLTTKVQTLQAESLIRMKDPSKVDTFVTSASDPEIHELEKRFNALVANLQNATKNEIAMRERTTNARLNALQAQINPHFVYNTLNIIAAKGIESGNEEVTDLCAQFGQMLRYSTDTRSKSVYVWEDVEHVSNYLMLLKARYEDGLEYSIHIPAEMNNLKIPRLTLQPLVENSIVHGFGEGTEVRRIHIRGEIQNGEMLLEVRDNGQGFQPELLAQIQAAIEAIMHHPAEEPTSNGHIGILNTCWRLVHYNEGAPISMQISNDCGALVRLRIPLTQNSGEKKPGNA